MPSNPLHSLFNSLQADKNAHFLRGFALPFRAAGLCWTYKALRRHSLFAALLTALLLLGCAVGAWFLSSYGVGLLWEVGDSRWQSVAQWAVRLLVWGVLFALASISLPPLLLAPLQDGISETTEKTFRPLLAQNSWLKTTGNSFLQSLLRLSLLYGGSLLLFAFSFLPLVGPLSSLLGILWVAMWLSLEHISTPLLRNKGSFLTGLQMLRKRKALFLGFGLGCYVLLWVPILQFFLIPGATVGGTLLYLSFQNELLPPQRPPSPPQ